MSRITEATQSQRQVLQADLIGLCESCPIRDIPDLAGVIDSHGACEFFDFRIEQRRLGNNGGATLRDAQNLVRAGRLCVGTIPDTNVSIISCLRRKPGEGGVKYIVEE